MINNNPIGGKTEKTAPELRQSFHRGVLGVFWTLRENLIVFLKKILQITEYSGEGQFLSIIPISVFSVKFEHRAVTHCTEISLIGFYGLMLSITVIEPEKLDHDSKDAQEREARSCNALQLYIATILNSMKYPNGGDPSSGFVLKSPYLSELFLQSTEYAHLCNLKSVWKCEPRTAFTTPLEKHDQKMWKHVRFH